MSDIYDGQQHVGPIAKAPNGFAAFDLVGKKLGVFTTQAEAIRRVLTPIAPSPAETIPDFDADDALLRAIDALARESAR